jgi:general stress protein YciG
MSSETQRAIASKGGRAGHVKGTAHEWTPDEAREAGRRGGRASTSHRADAERPAPSVPAAEPHVIEPIDELC